jgi:hypothetical protein
MFHYAVRGAIARHAGVIVVVARRQGNLRIFIKLTQLPGNLSGKCDRLASRE